MKLALRRRRHDRKLDSPFGYFRRFAREFFALAVAGGALYTGFTYFAAAADVDKKFQTLDTKVDQRFEQLDRKIDVTAAEERKYRIENELFRLRSLNSREAGVKAQIQRFEADLQSIDNRLRDLTNDERSQRRKH